MVAYRGSVIALALWFLLHLQRLRAEGSHVDSEVAGGGSALQTDASEANRGRSCSSSTDPGDGSTGVAESPGTRSQRGLVQVAASAALLRRLAEDKAAHFCHTEPCSAQAPAAHPAPLLVLQLQGAAASAVRGGEGSRQIGVFFGLIVAIPSLAMVACHCHALCGWSEHKQRGQPEPGSRRGLSFARRCARAILQPSSGWISGARPRQTAACPRPGPQLCSELVVPSGMGCAVAVKLSSVQDSMRVIEIFSLEGEPVFKANIRRPLLWPLVSTMAWNLGPLPAITLMGVVPDANVPEQQDPGQSSGGAPQRGAAEPADTVVGTCIGGTEADGRRRVFVYGPSGQRVGTLSKEGTGTLARYLFSTNCGDDWMVLDGDFAVHVVLVSNSHLEPLAVTQPCAGAGDSLYNLRCGQGADVGLVILCLAAIDEMEVADFARVVTQ